MKTKFITVLTAFIFVVNTYSQSSVAYVNNQLVVKFKDHISDSNISRSAKGIVEFGITKIDKLNTLYECTNSDMMFKTVNYKTLPSEMQNIYVFTFSQAQDILSLVEEYMQTEFFEYVEPNYIGHSDGIQITPNDGSFNQQWGLYNNSTSGGSKIGADINAKCAWDITTGDANTIVAIMDSGCKLNHTDFTGRIWQNIQEIAGNGIDDDANGYIDDTQGWDFVNSDNNPTDDNGHGSNVTGIIGCTGNNSTAIAGVNWKCKLMILKTNNSSGSVTSVNLNSALQYAADKGVKVINLSMGWTTTNAPAGMQAAIDYAYNKGVLIVVSMGNDNYGNKNWPAGCNHVMAVGASKNNDQRCNPFNWGGGSNYGNWISVVAPGNNILGASYSNNGTSSYSGTSQSCPMVAGTASLLFAVNSELSPDSVKKYIEQTAVDMVGVSTEDVKGFDNYMGWGRIDACKALQKAKDVLTTSVSVPHKNNTARILFPNPFSENAKIILDERTVKSSELKTIIIYNILGKEVKKNNQYENEITINRDGMENGIYFYRIICNDLIIASEKFVLTLKQ